ncbi:MAG: quinone-dependent dihydroorotate dehydrogenase, partial [Limisphaerales bacterium]
IFDRTQGKLPIIGVGGIFNADHAWEKIQAGASLIQCYTGLVYEGPSIAQGIVRGLSDRLIQSGCRSLSEAVGVRSI